MIDEVYTLNPYDPCVANNIIESKQCTIYWHVDDLKISHVNPKVVDSVLVWLEKKFGKLVTNRGKRHSYLGVYLDFQKDGPVGISIVEYLR